MPLTRIFSSPVFRRRSNEKTTKVAPSDRKLQCIVEQRNVGDVKRLGGSVDQHATHSVKPTLLEYSQVAAKETLGVLSTAAAFIPVPFLKVAFDLGVKVLQTCQDVSAFEESAQELGYRVSNIMLTIVDNLTCNINDPNDPSIVTSVNKIKEEITFLTSTLETILQDLEEITSQNRAVLAFFPEVNKTKINRCVFLLTAALERFHLGNDLRNSHSLHDLQSRLHKIYLAADRIVDIHEQVGNITELLAKTTTHTSSNALAREPMPVKPRVFHGRDNEIQEISQFLCNEKTSRVCILGPGGMGKTSLSAAIVESGIIQSAYAKSHRFWVPCIQATSIALFLQLLYNYLRISRSTGDVLEDIISELNASRDPRIILLDNFETLWNKDNTRDIVTRILSHLDKIRHVAILMTIRGTEPPCMDYISWQQHNLTPVHQEASRRIFNDLCPNKDDPDVDKLLVAVGHLPFAVSLLAKRGKKSKLTATRLLSEWSKLGTTMFSNSLEGNLNQCISLSVDSDLVKQSRDATALLAILSLLPAGTSVENLRWWASNLEEVSLAIATLTDAALLDENSTSLFVIPVVQSFMSSTNRIPDTIRIQVHEACCQFVTTHACRYYDLGFEQNAEALAAEDANIQSILLSSISHDSSSSSLPARDKDIDALLRFTWYRYDTRPSLEVAQHTLELARLSKNSRYIAIAMSAVGCTHWRLCNFESAEQHLAKAYDLLITLPSEDDPNIPRLIIECVWCLSQTRINLGRPSQELVSFLRELYSRLDAAMGDFERGRLLKALGFCLFYAREHAEALDKLSRSAELFRRMSKTLNCRYDLADSMQLIAKMHHFAFQIPEALAAIDEAGRVIDRASNKRMCAIINRIYGEILITDDKLMDALPKLKTSLLLCQDVGHLLGTAWTLEHFGYVYMCRGGYEDAIAAYEAARDAFVEMDKESSAMGKEGLERCQENLVRIDEKKRNPEKDVSLIRYVSAE